MAKHLVARCAWQTTLDHAPLARPLQDWISQFCRNSLQGQLNRFFDQICPDNQIWQIDALELDLGVLCWEDLARDLPQRLQQALQAWFAQARPEQIKRLPLRHASAHTVPAAMTAQPADSTLTSLAGLAGLARLDMQTSQDIQDLQDNLNRQDTPSLAALRCFLQSGTLLWWQARKTNLRTMILDCLQLTPDASRALLLELGQAASVRQRLVWQAGPSVLPEVVRLLEPEQADMICDYVTALGKAQREQNFVSGSTNEFSQQTWLGILEYLLQDRGTLFNTTEFVRANLQHLAQHYQISFGELLHQCFVAVAQLAHQGRAGWRWFVVLQTLHQAEPDPSGRTRPSQSGVAHQAGSAHAAAERVSDLWATLQALLHQARAGTQIMAGNGWQRISLAQLLWQLGSTDAANVIDVNVSNTAAVNSKVAKAEAIDTKVANADPARLRTLLYHEGKSAHVRRALVRHLAEPDMARLIALLEPQEHEFITSHASHAQRALGRSRVTRDAVWQVVLGSLLAQGQSRFQRQQWVRITIAQICREQGLNQADFIAALIGSLRSRLASAIHLDLLSILHQLLPAKDSHLPRPALANWLANGQGKAGILVPTLPCLPGDGLTSVTMASATMATTAWAHHRLASLIRPTDLPWLFCASLPPAQRAIWLKLHEQFWRWQARLPALAGVDLIRRWPAWNWAALLASGQNGDFWQQLAGQIHSHGIDCAQLAQQLQALPDAFACPLCAALLTWSNTDQAVGTRARHISADHTGHPPNNPPNNLPNTQNRPSATAAVAPANRIVRDAQAAYLQHPRLAPLLRHLLFHGKPPRDLACAPEISLQTLLADVIGHAPARLASLLAGVPRDAHAMARLMQALPFSWLLAALRACHPEQVALLARLANWEQQVRALALPGSTPELRSALLLPTVLRAWLAHDWSALTPQGLMRGLLWQLTPCYQPETLNQALATLPAAWQRVLSTLRPKHAVPANAPSAPPASPLAATSHIPYRAPNRPKLQSWPIRNAGLVILNGYLSALLGRLGQLDGNQFVSPQAQANSVHYLQFLASGQSYTTEPELVLNKLLCGLDWQAPVPDGIEISAQQQQLCHGLLKSAISHWSAIGKSSLAGFRGNWLVRPGLLSDSGDHIDLHVEKRTWDVLLARAPFSFTVIKLPWMQKPLYVNWPS